MSQELAQEVVRFLHEQCPQQVHAWLAGSTELLLQRRVLASNSWRQVLLQEPWLLLERPQEAHMVGVPKRGELQVPLVLPSLPAEQQVEVVRAALQHWHGKVSTWVPSAGRSTQLWASLWSVFPIRVGRR